MQVNQTQTDIAGLLQQMRTMRDQSVANSNINPILQDQALSADKTQRTDFGDMLETAVQSVNHLQKVSSKSSNDFVLGKEDDLVKVMVNSQKASLGFQAMVQVRNRFVTAYQDIMNMPI